MVISILWDVPLIQTLFLEDIKMSILNICILRLGEQDSMVWAASSSGTFSVKSAHRVIQPSFNIMMVRENDSAHKNWELIWKTSLYPRHKFLLWKILSDTLPTRERLRGILKIQQEDCLICGYEVETTQHLFNDCPFMVAMYANSQWQLHSDRFIRPSLVQWLWKLLSNHSKSLPRGVDQEEFLHFVLVAFENIWRVRNEIRTNYNLPDWDEFCRGVNVSAKS